MSLLHRGTELVTVFAEEVTTDDDGNVKTRPSAVGVVARAVVQPLGTPTEGKEESDVGYISESRYRLRLTNWRGGLLGPQSQVEWQGRRYSVHGEPKIFTGSPQTAHIDYEIRRS